MKTSIVKPPAPTWFLVDAKSRTIGRIATHVAHLLRGKHKVGFSPHQLWGDHVVVVNVAKVSIPFRKLRGKVYYRHTGYTGHLKRVTLEALMRERPLRALELAVAGMLPRNQLRREMLKRLHVFGDETHSHEAQKPVIISV